MTPDEELKVIGEQAAKALAHGLSQATSFHGPDGKSYALSVVSGPIVAENNWVFVIDVGLPDQKRRIEFSIVQTGWGGFQPGVK